MGRSPSQEPTVRAFVALALPANARAATAAVQRRLMDAAGRDSPVRWVRAEAIHLTLSFLGQIPERRVAEITAALAEAIRGRHALPVVLHGAGAFPTVERPRVIWLGLDDPSGALVALQAEVVRRLAELGFRPEERPFSPHLTLGRVANEARAQDRRFDRLRQALAGLQNATAETAVLTDLVLMQSRLSSAGSEYHPLWKVVLPERRTDG
jgi:2'-5' RNA ligase